MILYGRDWSKLPNFKGQAFNILDVELYCFRKGFKAANGMPGKAEHFWNIVGLLWGPESKRPVIRNPWSERMIEEMCRWRYLGITGPANSTKSDMGALWALVNYLADPLNTLCLVTSTSIKESRLRIWGTIEDYFNAVPGFPGKLTRSEAKIRFVDPVTKKYIERSGIHLLPSDQSNENDSVATIFGIKVAHGALIVIGDEMPDISPAILNAAQSNLSSQPGFQFIGLGNAKSPFDAFGQLITPKGGWKSIANDPTEYETELGYCLRFDALRSPNVLAKKILYKFLPKQSWIDEVKETEGENSLKWWRMVRGWFSPDGSSEGVYSESDITAYGAEERQIRWMPGSSQIPVAACDLSFTNGGDETVIQFGLFGVDEDGMPALLLTERVLLKAKADVKTTRNFQIARLIKEACVERGVLPYNFGLDTTGAGSPFADILCEIWSAEIYRVAFGGAPTNNLVGNVGAKPASDCYIDRCSEIWYSAKDFMRSGQIKGIDADMARDLISRKGSTYRAGGHTKMGVEPKKQTRARTGRSPDKGEAGLILVDLLRARHKFRAAVAQVINHTRKKQFHSLLRHAEAMEQTANLHLIEGRSAPQKPPRRPPNIRGGIIVRGGQGWSAAPLI